MEFTGSMTAPSTAFPNFHHLDQSKLFRSEFNSSPPYSILMSPTQAPSHSHNSAHSHHSSGCLHSDPSSPPPTLHPTPHAHTYHHHQQQHLSGNAYEIRSASDEDVSRWGTSPRSPFSSDSHLHQLPGPALLLPPTTSSPGILSYRYSFPPTLYQPTPTSGNYHHHPLPPPTPPAPAPVNVMPSSSSSSSTLSWGTSQVADPSPATGPPVSHPDPRSRSWSPDPFQRGPLINHTESKRPRTDPDLFTYACPPLSTPDSIIMGYGSPYAPSTLPRPRSPPSLSRRPVHGRVERPVVTAASKKKKREIREETAICGRCGRMMGRLTLRGTADEMVVSGGYEVVQTCRECQGLGSTTITAGLDSQMPIPFGGFTNFTVQLPTGTTMRKRNRRTDDVTAPTTCDCCGRQLGVGGIVARNGRSAIQFAVEVVCVGCVDRYRRCTDCGGGGGSRLGVGKWRCKELFSDGRRTCVLSHQRQGGNGTGETRNVIWRVGEVEVDGVLEQVKELVKHSLYAALATPEMLESGVARVTKFEDIKTMYINGWKRIEQIMKADVEKSEGRRRYVGLRWSKPHPRKGPKRPTPAISPTEEQAERTLIEPGKELTGFVLAEWDMAKGTLFIAVAMPWQSGDALESTSGLTHETLLAARSDREDVIRRLVGSGQMSYESAYKRFPPIEHLWTTLFFDRDSRLIQFLEKRKQFKRLSEYVAMNRDICAEDFRQSFLSSHELDSGIWETWVRRERSVGKGC